MPTPVRYTSGVSTDPPWQPLGQYGLPCPTDWCTMWDDFTNTLGVTNYWTSTVTANGTIALTAGDGGLVLFTTNSSTPAATDIAQIQAPIASFVLPSTVTPTTPTKKMIFGARCKLDAITEPGFFAGFFATGANLYTTPVNGLYFYKAAAGVVWTVNSAIGSAVTTVCTIPAATVTASVIAATFFDIAIVVDRYQAVNAYMAPVIYTSGIASAGLFGSVTQSGTGTVVPERGPVIAGATIPWVTATANLAPGIGITTGGATVQHTLTLDFMFAAKER
jgi:hypothetical protein